MKRRLRKEENHNILSSFPTIKMLEEAILFFASNDTDINYNKDNNVFLVIYMTPFPVRDDGGSIDSVGFREEKVTIDFQQAYKSWLDMNEIFRTNDYEAIAPTPWVMPKAERGADFDIDDLPF